MKNIEAEKDELVLQNESGTYAIIPANKREEVKRLLSEGCYDCIDRIVESLPKASDYAQDGTTIDPIYYGGIAPTVTVGAEAPNWLKFKREYEQSNSFDIEGYVNERFNNPRGRQAIDKIDSEQFRQGLYNEAKRARNKELNTYVADKLLQQIPQNNQSRAEYLNQFIDKEQQIIKQVYPKYSPSLYDDTKRGLASLVERSPLDTFNNILNSKDYTDAEKRELLQDYIDHPVMSKLGDAAKILSPLAVPSKMVQAAYKDDYTMQDALQGRKNDAGIVEDIVTDPLNLVGLGIWSKLKNTGSFSKVDDVYNSVQGLNPNQAIDKISKYLDDVGEYLTTKTVLKEAWRLNPNAYQYNLPDNMLWRGIGQEGMQDAIESGVFRAKPSGTQRTIKTDDGRTFNLGKTFDKTYYSPNFEIGDRYGQGIIAEVPKSSAEFSRRYSNSDWSLHTKTEIPIEQGRILQKDWLKGYKPTEVTKTIETNLKDLEAAKNYYSKYGYDIPDNLAEIAKDSKKTDELIQGLVNQHNTFVRGVSTNWEVLADKNPDIIKHLEEKGIDYKNDPEAAAKYMATHVPIQTGYGRWGLDSNVFYENKDAIYTSNSLPTAEGYTYGDGFIVKVKRPTDFTSANRLDWIEKNKLDFFEDDLPNASDKLKTKYYNLIEKRIEKEIRPKYYDKHRNTYLFKEGASWDDMDYDKWKIEQEVRKKLGLKTFNLENGIIKTDAHTKEKMIDRVTHDLFIKPEEFEDIANDNVLWEQLNNIDKKANEKYGQILNEYRYDRDKTMQEYDMYRYKELKKLNVDKLNKIIKDYEDKVGYAHYLHTGTPGTKLLDALETYRITPDTFKNKSRAHYNFPTKELSAGSMIPLYLYNQSSKSDKSKIKAEDGLVVEPPDLAGKLLNTIGGIESNNQYDIQYGGKRNPDLLNMTIDEVLQYQQGMKTSSAVGRYQFINKTLNDLVSQGYVTSDTKFTPETQDMLATKLLERRGLNKYLRGELTSNEFADNLSKEWAALPYNTNKSYYDKDGINKALISREDFMSLFADELNKDIAKQEEMQEQPASKLPVISLQEDDLSDYGIKNDVLQPITQDTIDKLLNPTELVTEIAEPEPSQLSIPDEVKSGLMSMLIQMKYISPGEKLTTDTLKMFVYENLQNLGNFPTDDQSLALITTELNK